MRSERSDARPAMTLLEIMVVIAIMGILFALSAAAVLRAMQLGQKSNTKTALDAIYSALYRQWQAVVDSASKDHRERRIPPNVRTMLETMAGTDSNKGERMRVLWVKMKLRQSFPMTFAEALNPAPLAPLPSYKKYLGDLGITAATASGNEAVEASVCLLMALQSGPSGTGFNVEDFGKGIIGDVTLTSGNKAKAFLDGWGSGIGFCRAPHGFEELNPGQQPQAGLNDPQDPEGYLCTDSWRSYISSSGLQSVVEQAIGHPIAGPGSFGVQSYRLPPVVASAGQDQKLGLNPTSYAPLSSDSEDNIAVYSINK